METYYLLIFQEPGHRETYLLVDEKGNGRYHPSSRERISQFLETRTSVEVRIDIPDNILEKAREKNIPGDFLRKIGVE